MLHDGIFFLMVLFLGSIVFNTSPNDYKPKQTTTHKQKDYTHKVTIKNDSLVYWDLYRTLKDDCKKDKNEVSTIYYCKLEDKKAKLVIKASFDNYEVE